MSQASGPNPQLCPPCGVAFSNEGVCPACGARLMTRGQHLFRVIVAGVCEGAKLPSIDVVFGPLAVNDGVLVKRGRSAWDHLLAQLRAALPALDLTDGDASSIPAAEFLEEERVIRVNDEAPPEGFASLAAHEAMHYVQCSVGYLGENTWRAVGPYAVGPMKEVFAEWGEARIAALAGDGEGQMRPQYFLSPGTLKDPCVELGREARRALQSPRMAQRWERVACRDLVESNKRELARGNEGFPLCVYREPSADAARARVKATNLMHQLVDPWVRSDARPPPPDVTNEIVAEVRRHCELTGDSEPES